VKTHVVRWFFRLFISGILLASALGKSLDLPGFVDVLITYQAIPALLLWPTALLITGFEWLLGAWVLSGWRLVTGALLSLALYAGHAIWMTLSLVRGLDLANCGCYGRFFPQPLRWYSPLEDLILVGMCYAVWKSARKVSAPH
jgi:Methylamine utilisation protein MauE